MKLQGPILVGTDFSGHHIAVNRVEELRGRSRPAPNADAGATGVAAFPATNPDDRTRLLNHATAGELHGPGDVVIFDAV